MNTDNSSKNDVFITSGLGCLYPFLPLHMVATGLNYEESRIISIIAPLISVVGPLTVAFLVDKSNRVASKKGTNNGKYLRVTIAICMLGAAIFYGILLAVPTLQRWEARRPSVSFACDGEGAMIFQERCTEEKTCYHWKKEKVGNLILTNCSYTCQKPSQFEKLYNPWLEGSPEPTAESAASPEDYTDEDDYGGGDRNRRSTNVEKVYVEPPHICQSAAMSGRDTAMCHVFTENSHLITINAKLSGATNQENETHSAEWCKYPLDGFMCHIPQPQVEYMASYKNTTKCIPKVECEVQDPYDSPKSVLADSQCISVMN